MELIDGWWLCCTPLYIQFGKYATQLDHYNAIYDNICTRVRTFAEEVGPDPYSRIFNAELLVDFAIDKKITDKSIDYIVRHFVYDKLATVQDINVQEYELQDLFNEFKHIILDQ